MLMHLGVDSTDSFTKGMCTTYVGTALVKQLLNLGVHFVDYPNLIRLNPNIPFKTRGNGAVALRFELEEKKIEDILAISRKTVENLAVFSDPQTNPGIAMYTGDIPEELHEFYKRALHRLLSVDDACAVAREVGAFLYGYKNKRGVIGALASIGETLKEDNTYELLAYRRSENWGKKRSIDPKTVIAMDQNVIETFFNYDYEEGTVCIAPHTVCPVLAGIRGETAESVKKALSLVDLGEPISKYMIFCTNQHTNFHFEAVSSVSEIVDYSSIIVEGDVVGDPVTIKGGHVFFELENEGRIYCAAFEPTKRFRDIARSLIKGDRVRAYGGVKPPGPKKKMKAINLERLDILDLRTSISVNPRCPSCGKSMTSKGSRGGYKCKKCKITDFGKKEARIDRSHSPGFYEPPPSAWRHLYKMIARKKTNSRTTIRLIDSWISLCDPFN